MTINGSDIPFDNGSPLYPDLLDVSVFITGGGSGIGAAFTRAFALQGAKVGFVSMRTGPAGKLCDEIERETDRRPIFIQCDIREIDALRKAICNVRSKHGPIQVLINNAARDTRHAVDKFTVEEWDDTLNTNLRPYFFSAQAILDDMKARGQGSIINLGSNCAELGLTGYPAYVTAKAAIKGMTKALARELGADNIRINALAPGWVITERQKKMWVTEQALEECLKEQCLKSVISEEDIANVALFLASNASAMITGQTIIVDGGRV